MPCAASDCRWITTCPTLNARAALCGADASSVQLLSGWHQDDPGGSLWSKQTATLLLLNPGSRSCLTISGLLPPSIRMGQNTLGVECDGHPLGVVRNCSRRAVEFGFRSLIPTSSRDLLHIRFHVEDAHCPAESGDGPDRRALGFALFGISAERLGPAGWVRVKWADAVRRSKSALGELLLTSIPRLIESLGRRPSRTALPQSAPSAGLSIVILDLKDRPALDTCRRSIEDAVRELEEPCEVVIASDARTFRAGLKSAKHPWIYVIGSGYTLDRGTLPEVLRWRAPHVFAVGSSVGDPGGGWIRVRLRYGLPELEEARLETPSPTRGAPGLMPGTALYNRDLLRRICRADDGYISWDWRSLEWSVRAWKMGFETIFCPDLRLDRGREEPVSNPAGSEADGLRFLIRNTFPGTTGPRVLAANVRGGIARARVIASCYATRFRERAYPFNGLPLEQIHQAYYLTPRRDGTKPGLIFVSPYVIFPPSHGSAVGMEHLLRALKERYGVHLISDEADAYGPDSVPYLSGYASVRLLSGRAENAGQLCSRIARIESHSHSALKESLRMVIATYRPRFVEIEHVELAGLIDVREGENTAWVLNLHDVLLSGEAPGTGEEDRYELDLIGRYDSLICCSREDASLLNQSNVVIIPNGVDFASVRYEPSPLLPRILFIGPWRVSQNLCGIEEFLREVYPVLLRELDGLELWYLGGKGASTLARERPGFGQRGVRIIEYVDDVQPLLRQCALTINPISGNRGSCMKVAESLAAGRVCVSTREGARGYLHLGIRSLVTCGQVRDFVAPLRSLLGDVDYRRSLEPLDESQRYVLSWDHSREQLLGLYSSLDRITSDRRRALTGTAN